MGSNNYICNLTLGFSHGRFDQNPKKYDEQTKEEKNTLILKYDDVLPPLSLGSLQSQSSIEIKNNTIFRGIATSTSPNRSYSNLSTIKKEKVMSNEFEIYKTALSRMSDEDEDQASPRKKLRLTKEQSSVLEDSFKDHTTLNPIEKQALARQLNLRPRQIEVWFQNRRARTKLKQTEMDCELLKKCCETLTQDNQRLHNELVQLRALKMSPPTTTTLFMQMQAATITMCPACERITTTTTDGDGGGGGGGDGVIDGCSKPSQVFKPKARLCTPFAQSPTIC